MVELKVQCPMSDIRVTPLTGMLVLYAALALSGCASPPRERSLVGLDLADPAVIGELQDDLPTRERAALATYALLHWEGSKAYCGQPMFRGPQPATIGEAIDKTITFEDDLAAKRAAEREPKSALELRVEKQRQLVDRFEELSLEITQLEDSPTTQRQKSVRLTELRKELTKNRRERAELDTPLPDTGG